AREQAALLLRTAAAGAVLLRNEGGLLPLSVPSLCRVAVLGAGAASARVQGGGSAEVFPPYVVSPLEGLRAAFGPGVEVVHAVGAPTSTGPAALRPAPIGTDDVRDPATGEPGVRARFLDAHGAELDSQHRRSGRLLWSPSEVPEGAAQVEVTARLRTEVAGRWQIGVAGTGRYALDVDGTTVFDGVIEMDTDDIAAVALAPPYEVVDVELAADQVVDLAVRHQVGTAVFGVSATLGAARPAVPEDEQMAAAVALARSADAVVVVVGTTSEIESEGFDRTTLALPGRQDELVRAVAAANPRTAVVVNSGGPVALPWYREVPAVLLSWFPGQECGHALADVLTGAVEPGGRLPTTWAATEGDGPVPTTVPTAGRLDYAEGLHVGHRGWLRAGAEPAAWFGHGLGYTTWRVGDVTAPPDVAPGEAVTVRARVANTGARRGAEVVQVYLSRPDSALDRPVRWLAGFARVEAGAGEEVDVEVEVPRRALEHWSAEQGAWATEPGEFRLHVGRSVVVVDAELTVSAT
ncbi:MAG: beta-glucosidase, partial [uncultured Quadrisphaera sp.]